MQLINFSFSIVMHNSFLTAYLVLFNISRKLSRSICCIYLASVVSRCPQKSTNNCELFVLESFHPSFSLNSSSIESQNKTAEKHSLSGWLQLSSLCFFKQNAKVEIPISNLKELHRQRILRYATRFVIFAHCSSNW